MTRFSGVFDMMFPGVGRDPIWLRSFGREEAGFDAAMAKIRRPLRSESLAKGATVRDRADAVLADRRDIREAVTAMGALLRAAAASLDAIKETQARIRARDELSRSHSTLEN